MSKSVVKSEIAGVVTSIVAAPGTVVQEGDELLLLESMKMEIPVVAPCTGKVGEVLVSVGQPVKERQPVATITP